MEKMQLAVLCFVVSRKREPHGESGLKAFYTEVLNKAFATITAAVITTGSQTETDLTSLSQGIRTVGPITDCMQQI